MHMLCCQQIQEVQEMAEVAQVLQNPDQKLPVKRARADNTTKWSKFVQRVLADAKVLVCYAHATGNAKFLGMLSACHA